MYDDNIYGYTLHTFWDGRSDADVDIWPSKV